MCQIHTFIITTGRDTAREFVQATQRAPRGNVISRDLLTPPNRHRRSRTQGLLDLSLLTPLMQCGQNTIVEATEYFALFLRHKKQQSTNTYNISS